MHRWACIIATQLGADFGWRAVEDSGAHYHIYLHVQQGLLQDSAYLSIRAAPSFRANQTWEGRGVGGKDTGKRRGKKGALGSFGSKATPGPAPCSVHSSRLGGGDGGGPFCFSPFRFPAFLQS